MRLIDADALLQDLKGSKKDLQEIRDSLKYDEEKRICDCEIVTFGECIMRVNNAPTVDIKTEVAREIFAEIEGLVEQVAFESPWSERWFRDGLGELKNKYTKGE